MNFSSPVSESSSPISITFDVGYYTNSEIALITSENQGIYVFDGASVTLASTGVINNGIIETLNGFTFVGNGSTLNISRPIDPTHPEYSYDFIGTGSSTRSFSSKIVGIKATMSGLYIFTEDSIEYMGSNALQNVAGSATFISSPIGKSSAPINNNCIAAA